MTEAMEIVEADRQRLKARNIELEKELKATTVHLGRTVEDLERFINQRGVVETIGTHQLVACGEES